MKLNGGSMSGHMAKRVILFALIMFMTLGLIFISACNKNTIDSTLPHDEEPLESQVGTIIEDETSVRVDGRSIVWEDGPENNFEYMVFLFFAYEITQEFYKKAQILPITEESRRLIEADKANLEEGIYIQSYVLHKISVFSDEEYARERLDSGEINPLFYYGLEALVEKYKLSEYAVVNVDFTITHSEKATSMGPQWGDGRYNRSFLVGKTEDDSDYRIYDFGMVVS